MLDDLRHALRLLRRSPGVTILAILSIALGTGAAAVVFTAVKSVLIEPFPYADPSHLVDLRTDFSAGGRAASNWVYWSDTQDAARRSQTLASVGIYHYSIFNAAGGPGVLPEALYGLRISASLFPTLGVKPFLGRNILPEEDQPNRNNVILLSYGLWQRRFHSDPGVIGTSVQINGHASTIIGVMPPDFDFPLRIAATARTPQPYMEFWAPLGIDPAKSLARDDFGYAAIARLRSGVSLAQATDDLARISRELAREFPHSYIRTVSPIPLRQQALGSSGTGLWILFGASAMFMLIGCANVANLLLARGLARGREFAIRFALGASRSRVIRQLIVESCVLSMLGGAGGFLLTLLAWTILPAVAPLSIPRLAAARADAWIFAFSMGIAALNGIVFGILPAFRASQSKPSGAFRASGRRGSLRNSLVTAEVAVAMTLVITGSLLAASFLRLIHTDIGFDSSRITASIIVPAGDRYSDPASRTPLWRGILAAVERLPDVESAGTVNALPFTGENNGGMAAIDPAEAASGTGMTAEVDAVSANYLDALGVRLLRGRGFREDDVLTPHEVAIVDANAARRLFPSGDALGQRICVNCEAGRPAHWKEIIGVAENIHHASLEEASSAQVYITSEAFQRADFLVVRSRRPSAELAREIRTAVASVDPQQPVYLTASMSSLIGDSIASRRFIFYTFFATGLLSLLFAAAGIYGVVAYATSRRTREIGIRMAIGATPRRILTLVLHQGMHPVVLGIVLGTFGALAASLLLQSSLPGLTSVDPAIVMAAIVLVAISAALACWIPAHRASRIDPKTSLQQE